jgi:hypothetical protein
MTEGRLLRPVNLHDTPSGARWTYQQPSTQKLFSEPSMKQLTAVVQKHRDAMLAVGRDEEDLDLRPGWYERFLHDVCIHMNGKARCEEYTTVDGKPTRRWIGINDLKRFLQTASRWKVTGFQWLEGEEPARRAEICLKCPKHDELQCFSCHGILTEVAELLGKQPDTRLKGCQVCGCACSVSVHIPLEVMQYPELANEWPEGCWHRPSVS